jgi:hypothetical protein
MKEENELLRTVVEVLPDELEGEELVDLLAGIAYIYSDTRKHAFFLLINAWASASQQDYDRTLHS